MTVQPQSKQDEPAIEFLGAEALLIEKGYNEDGLRQKCRDLIRERDAALAALLDIQKERSHGATANSEYIDRRISEGLGEGRA